MAEPVVPVGISREPVSASSLVEVLESRADGAVVTFEGRVRGSNLNRPVARLHYEAYEAMACEVLREIVREARDRFEIGNLGALHRSGTLAIGEVSVAIAVSAPHRDAAFAAARYVIEQIKHRLPIWKREEYEDGSASWLDGVSPADGLPGASSNGADDR